MAKTKKTDAIDRAAQALQIKRKSVQRRIQRAAKKGVAPKIEGVSKYTQKQIKEIARKSIEARKPKQVVEPRRVEREIEYPRNSDTGAMITVEDAANPLRNSSKSGSRQILVTATFEISRDKSTRTIRLYCSASEVAAIKSAGSLYDALAEWTNATDGAFLQGASIHSFKIMEIV